MPVKFEYAVPQGEVVASGVFSGNLLFTASTDMASFGDVASGLGVNGVRYPGGSMTEMNFDMKNPDTPVNDTGLLYDDDATTVAVPLADGSFVKISNFMSWCAETNIPATIVLPTRNILAPSSSETESTERQINPEAVEDLKGFVKDLLAERGEHGAAFADAPVAAFEIGNEYWGSGGMSSMEYGQVVNAVGAAISEALSELGADSSQNPTVLVQMGAPWGDDFRAGGIYDSIQSAWSPSLLDLYKLTSSDFTIDGKLTWDARVKVANLSIINEIKDPLAIARIDGVIDHYYLDQSSDFFHYDSASLRSMDLDLSHWISSFSNSLEFHVTEWNIKSQNYEQLGLAGAGALVEQMENMIRLGAESAFVWGVQHNTTNDLAGTANDDSHLSPIGAAFSLMAESLVGTQRIESNVAGGELEINAFASDEIQVFFVISRSSATQSVNLDLSSIVTSYHDFSATRLGVDLSTSDELEWTPEGVIAVEYFREHDVAAQLTSYSGYDFGEASDLHFDLDPFEIMRLTFTRNQSTDFSASESPIWWQGENGWDSVVGGEGNDTLRGEGGRDHLQGGGGDDLLHGGRGNDWLEGEDNDVSSDGNNNDQLLGGRGEDYLNGGTGDDTLFGGPGRDKLHGGDGNDLLRGSAGKDTYWGGLGDDTFVFRALSDSAASGKQVDVIRDFQQGNDNIDLHTIDASSILIGHNAFQFAGIMKFDNSADGSVRYEKFDNPGSAHDFTMIYVDTDGDIDAEMAIKILCLHDFTADDFIF